MNGSAVVGSGGQHTEPVKIINELADCLTVASQIFRQFHIGSCDLSHFQDNLNTLDFIGGSYPYRIGHQPVQAFLPVGGILAAQKKIPLPDGKNGAVVYVLFILAHSLMILWCYNGHLPAQAVFPFGHVILFVFRYVVQHVLQAVELVMVKHTDCVNGYLLRGNFAVCDVRLVHRAVTVRMD
ncbi:hypothetical protein M127_1797 [Bacteroides fragilis str. S6L5]|nr:hypothetical protein M127_1797 [Bacteroides fragilis str. S6L5]